MNAWRGARAPRGPLKPPRHRAPHRSVPSLRSSRTVAFASLIGTTIEWYDLFIFGMAAALVFQHGDGKTLRSAIGTKRT